MSVTTAPSAGTVEEVISLEDFEFPIPCSFPNCIDEAVWYAICPKDRSSEPACQFHRDDVESWSPRSVLWFSETCDHHIVRTEVIWEKIN